MDETELRIVDTHCHLWQLEISGKTWVTAGLKQLHRSFEPDDLAEASRDAGVRACVVVEAGETEAENGALDRMAASSDLIEAIVPWADLESASLEDELDRWQQNPKFRGVRWRFEGYPDPDVLARPSIVRGLRKIAERGLVFDFLVRTAHLKDLLGVYSQLPGLRGVVEHMAKPDIVGSSDSQEWHTRMRELARNTNVNCKISLSPQVERFNEILASPGQGWPVEAIRPYAQFLLEEFGPDRLMWGSDWPIALITSDYVGTFQAMREAVGPLDASNEQRLFAGTARRFYALA